MSPEEFEKAFGEIRDGGDRAAAIVAAALLESSLEDCIVMRLLPMSNAHRKKLFGGEGSFASFASKINLGFSLGLYGLKTKNDPDCIRRVRNEFAHYADRDFGHAKVVKLCAQLTDYGPGKPAQTPLAAAIFYTSFPGIDLRWRYLGAANEIGLKMLQEVITNPRHAPSPTLLP